MITLISRSVELKEYNQYEYNVEVQALLLEKAENNIKK